MHVIDDLLKFYHMTRQDFVVLMLINLFLIFLQAGMVFTVWFVVRRKQRASQSQPMAD